MRLITRLLFALFPLPLFAQYDDLLRNPDISWVAEYTADFELNPVYNDQLEEERNLSNVLRLVNEKETNGLYPDSDINYYLSQWLLDGLNDGNYACYADERLLQPLDPEAIGRRLNPADTIPDFNHPHDTAIVIHPVHSGDIYLFRARLVLFFSAATQAPDARLLALAPLIPEKDAEGNVTGYQPLLWIKAPDRKAKERRSVQKEATYVLQTRMKGNAPRMDQLHTRKGQFDLQQWAGRQVERPTQPCLSANDFKPVSPATLRALIFTTDTVVTFNDAGQADIERIVENNAIRQVEKLRFVQNWYFDERRHRFDCRVVAVAPLATVRDSEGNPRYDKPLFYVKNR